MSIHTAIIAAAGNGTRMQPFTCSVPKELLPIGTIPVIDYILYDCFLSGIDRILLVIRQNKTSLVDYLCQTSDMDFKKKLQISFVPQRKGYGTACILQSCRGIIQNENFAVLFPDELFFSGVPSLKQLIKAYEQTFFSTVGVFQTDEKSFQQYGIVAYQKEGRNIILKDIVEKPTENPPSYDALCGRFVFQNNFFQYLDNLQPTNGEYYLTDAIKKASGHETIGIQKIEGKRFDCGNKDDYRRLILESVEKENTFFSNL